MAQEASYEICLSRIRFPPELEKDFKEFMEKVYDSVSALKECIEKLDVDLGEAMAKAHEVEEIEDQADLIERRIRKKLYQLYRDKKIGILTLIELKHIVKRLGNIVDRAENASDRIPIITAKRRG